MHAHVVFVYGPIHNFDCMLVPCYVTAYGLQFGETPHKKVHLYYYHTVQPSSCHFNQKHGLHGAGESQTPSTGLQHHSTNHCHSWLRHRSWKIVSHHSILCFKGFAAHWDCWDWGHRMHGKNPGQQNKLAGLRSPLYHQHQTSTGLCDEQVCHVQHSTHVSLLNRLLHTRCANNILSAKTYRNVVKTKQSNTDTTRHKIPQINARI